MRKPVAASIIALTIAVGLAPAAASAEWGVLRWIPVLKEFYDVADAGRKILTDDLPGVVSDSFDLQETERRAMKFHPRPDAQEAPKIDGDRVFSRDPEVRARARDEYADFVASERERIANLQAHRDRIARQMAQMERRFEKGNEMLQRLPDLIDRSAKIPVVNEYMPNELAAAQLAADQNLRTLAGTIGEYRRIVADFDRIIRAATALHEAHVQTLRTVDVIHGNVPATGAQTVPRPGSGLPGTVAPAAPRVVSLSDRVGDAAGRMVGPSVGRAAGLSNTLIPMRQRAAAMAPRESGSGGFPSTGTGYGGGGTEQPGWIGTMTTYR